MAHRARASRPPGLSRAISAGLPLCPSCCGTKRLSTAEAERSLLEADASRKRRAEVIDKVAATLILQSALNRLKLFNI
jgi:putative Holliday junction resolvase